MFSANKIKKSFLKLKIFFEELPNRLKQFSLTDFSKVTFEIFKRKIADLFFKIRNTSKEDLKNNFNQFIKYIFSREFLFSQRFLAVLMFFLTFTSIYFYFSKFRMSEASGNLYGDLWYNDSWTYRQKLTIQNSSGTTVQNYVSDSSIAGASLITDGKIKSDCTDIRVINAANLVELSYWVDPLTCNTSKTNIFFKVPTLAANTTYTFYIYYGNLNASVVTVANSSLFTSTIPSLTAYYSFDDTSNNQVINRVDYTSYGGIGYGASTLPEGYAGKGIYLDGIRQFVSTPYTLQTDLTRAYTLITTFNPEGTMATGYPVTGESLGKFISFEDNRETSPNAAECAVWEQAYQDAVNCTGNVGVRQFTPPFASLKKVGVTNYFYDYNYSTLTRPSRAISMDGTNYFYQQNPTNILEIMAAANDMSHLIKIKPYGDVGDRRTIMAFGNTGAGQVNYALDYKVCSDNTLQFILDYNNSTNEAATLASPCLNNYRSSNKVSSIATMSIAANSNHWLTIVTQNIANVRYISVNGAYVASGAATNPIIDRGQPLYLGKASNSNKLNFKGEMDEYSFIGEGFGWTTSNYYNAGNLTIPALNYLTNFTKKSYVLFGNNKNNFYQTGFTNLASARFVTTRAAPSFNYNYNTTDANDYYQQYGGNIDNGLNFKQSFISPTINIFDGKYTLFTSQFDSISARLITTYRRGTTAFSHANTYTLTNSSGNLIIGAYINEDPDTATYPSEYFGGAMDEVFIYNRTLSSTQVLLHSSPYNSYISSNTSLWQPTLPSGATSNNQKSITLTQTSIIDTQATREVPLIYYKFNETSGQSAGNSIINSSPAYFGNQDSTSNAGQYPIWASESNCIQGSCLYFDGINDLAYLETVPSALTSFTDKRFDKTSFTISTWIRPLSSPNPGNFQSQNMYILGTGDGGGESFSIFIDSDKKINIQVANDGIDTSTTTLNMNKWQHLAVSYDYNNKTVKIYLNGTLTETLGNIYLPVNVVNIYLGADPINERKQNSFFKGYMDEFKFYNFEASDDKIKSDYRNGAGFITTIDPDNLATFNMMAYYPFDEDDRGVGFDASDLRSEGGYSNSTINNAVGLFNNAYSPPTATAYFSIASNTYTNLTDLAAYTMWVKPTSTTADDSILLNKDAGVFGGGFSLKYISSNSKFQGVICGTTLSSTSTFPTSSWSHLVIQSNSRKAQLYVNSKLEDVEDCLNNYTGQSANTNIIEVGGDGTNKSLTGFIDEFKMINEYLNPKQVKLLFNYFPRYTSYGNIPTAFYKLDETDGTSSAPDSSGNANTLEVFTPATNQNSWTTFGKIGGSYNFSTNASTVRNVLADAGSTITTGATRPLTFIAWVAFSEPFYGNYTVGQHPVAISVGDSTTTDTYQALSFRTNASRILWPQSWSFNNDIYRLGFSSPYLHLTIPTDQPVWYHVASFVSATDRKIYINGELVAQDSGGYAVPYSIGNNQLVLGGLAGQGNLLFQFQGLLDEVKIYEYERTQDQIKRDMRNSSRNNGNITTDFNNPYTNQIIPIISSATLVTTPMPYMDINFDTPFRNSDLVYFRKENNTALSAANTNLSFTQNGYLKGGANFASNSLLTFTNDPNLSFDNDGYGTLSFFIKPESTSNFTIARSTIKFVLEQRNQKLHLKTGSGFDVTTTNTLANGVWNHVFIQKRTPSFFGIEIYINAVLTGQQAGVIDMDLRNLEFGASTNTVGFDLDELKIYNDFVLDTVLINNLKNVGAAINFGSFSYNQNLSTADSALNNFYCVSGETSTCSYPAYEFKFDDPGPNFGTFANSGLNQSIGLRYFSSTKARGYIQSGITGGTVFSTPNIFNQTGENSISFWVKIPTNAVSSVDIFANNGFYFTPQLGNFMDILINGNENDGFFSNYTNSNFPVNDGQWHNISINNNGTTFKFYLDGVYLKTNTYTSTGIYGDEFFRAGDNTLDEIRAYTYQRTPNQIALEYANNKPYAYYKMNECSGTIFNNSNVNLYRPIQGLLNGTRYNNTSFKITKPSGSLNFGNCSVIDTSPFYKAKTGKYGSAFYFDGTNYGEGNDFQTYMINSQGNSSISFWINNSTNPTQTATIVGPLQDSYKGHKIEYSNGYIKIKLNTDGVNMVEKLSSIKTIPTNTWTHVAVTTDETNYKIYINGSLDNSASGYSTVINGCTNSGGVVCTNNPSVVGKGFAGFLDEIKFYNFPMTQNQVRVDANNGAAVVLK